MHKFLRAIALALTYPLCCETILVTNTDGSSFTVGSLGYAIVNAVDGDIIDCSPISGQTIFIAGSFPAVGYTFSSPSSSLTILGSGVTLDGGGMHPVFSLGQGSLNITDFIIQNGFSKGGNGGEGFSGGGGGTGGGGALYIHQGSSMTISSSSLYNNQAVGGAGGAGNATGGCGGGGGGFGGGSGGPAIDTGSSEGAAGGGGGNSGGASGGRDGGNGSPNTFSNFAGAGGGGEIPGTTTARAGGTNASMPAHIGGSGGQGTTSNGAGAGGGAGSGGNGFNGSNSIDEGGSGIGGAGGLGFGFENTYGAGGGGGGGNGGGAGYGASGGGGGFKDFGGGGGALGGGGGACATTGGGAPAGGNGGFGAGGGGGLIGGIDNYGLGGSGGSASNAPAGGGGGSGLGGAIYIQQGAVLIIQDGMSFSGNTTTAGIGGVAAGSGSGSAGSALGADIFIQAGGSITFQIDDLLTLSNPIEGGGFTASGNGLIKSGTGTLGLTGINTYLGSTLIQSGILNLNGIINSDTSIDAGATLSGNAIVFGTLNNAGTISPGNSIGQVITNTLYLYPTSSYNVEINGAGQSDRIIVSGSAHLDGNVFVMADPFSTTTPITYTILNTGTGFTGTFSYLTSSAPALMSLIYDPLTVQLTYLPLSAIALKGNALSAATCFSTVSGADASAVNTTLMGLNAAQIQSAFAEMSPVQFSGLTQVQLLDAILVRSTYSKHLNQSNFKKKRRCKNPFSLWMDTLGQWQNQKGDLGYRDTTVGATIGADYSMHHLSLGVAFSYTHDHFHLKESTSKALTNSYYGGIYGYWYRGKVYMDAAFLGAYNHFHATRQLKFGTINRHAHSKHSGNEWLSYFGLGVKLGPSHFQWTPYLNLDYVHQHESRYSENGAGSLDLEIDRKNASLFQGEVGISLSAIYQAWKGVIIPTLTAAYVNQTPCSSKNYQAHFVNSSCTFTGKGRSYERNLFAPQVMLTYQSACKRVNASLYYEGKVGSSYWAQDVGFDLTFRF